MPTIRSILLALLPVLASVVSAHKEPKTPQEVEVQRALQAAAYHVRHVPDLLLTNLSSLNQKLSVPQPLQNTLHLGNDPGHKKSSLDGRLCQDMKNSSQPEHMRILSMRNLTTRLF